MNDWQPEYARLEERILAFIQSASGDFEELALEIYRFQRQHNEPFRQFCEYRGVGEGIENWEDIPAVPQQAFKMSRLVVFPSPATAREFRTSGTTGEGFGAHFLTSTRLYDAAIDAGWRAAGLPLFQALILAPSPPEAPHSSLSHMLDRLAGSQPERFFIRHGQFEKARLRTEIAAQNQPMLLLGTALAFLNLLEQDPQPLPLPPGSLLMETGGYKGSGRTLQKADLYACLTDYFALPVESLINEYGMTELSSQCYTRGLGQPHRSGPWLRHRVINPENGHPVASGERGVLQLFDLANLGSVLALQTEDLALETGDGFLLLGRDPAAIARGCSRSADEMLQP